MASGCAVWIVLLVGALAISTASSDIGTPCKVLCDNGAEMTTCERRTEIFNCCGPCSEPTCAEPNPKQDCKEGCKAGCFCRNGYVRLHDGGPCVPIDDCKNTY
ncbi:venom peptide SjAPI-2 [Anopheles moucheti]|uniref:venom peptide SjAPI-2 n=1 Tax=Anopheles moucheti TaxID=186751 RepID=UPI0022F0E1F8|nr:venom peptide SjAPI-2 [Anopheles moucheti]